MIAEGLEVPAGRVYKLLRERGVLRSASEARKLDQACRRGAAEQERPKLAPAAGKRGKEWAPELQAQVLERYAAGEAGPAIAEALGLAVGVEVDTETGGVQVLSMIAAPQPKRQTGREVPSWRCDPFRFCSTRPGSPD